MFKNYGPFSFYLQIFPTSKTSKGFSINGVTALGGEGQSFCDERSRALAIKSVMMEGVSKLCEIP